MRRIVLAIAISLAAVCQAGAADNPNQAKGFEAGKLYQFGDLAHVNLFNGNLNIALPIGQTYHVDGNLSYGFTLAYGGNNWETASEESTCDPNDPTCVPRIVFHSFPSKGSNAGFGWYLSNGGQLLADNEDNGNVVGEWTYRTADGALHGFNSLPAGMNADPNLLHTGAGTYLRMKTLACDDPGVVGTCRDVEFPDGTIHRFKEAAGTPLVSIRDLHGNRLGVSSTASSVTYTEPGGRRTQTVAFERINIPSPTFPDDPAFFDVVKSVTLTAFNTATAVYTFHYSPNPADIDQPTLIQRQLITGCACNDGQVSQFVYVPLLTSVTAPDGTSYVMTYDTTSPDRTGSIGSLTLPTLGRYDWTYQGYVFPAIPQPQGPPGGGVLNLPDNVNHSVGLFDQIKSDAAGTALERIHYNTITNHQATGIDTATTLINTVSRFAPGTPDTLISRTVNYFSVAHEPNGFNYGLPFTKDAIGDLDAALAGEGIVNPDTSGPKPRYLSTKTYDGTGNLLGYSHLAYSGTVDPTLFTGVNVESQKTAQRTVVNNTIHDTSATTDYSDFDGYGHFRTTTTGGDSPGQNVRSSTTAYNKADANVGGSIFDTGTYTPGSASGFNPIPGNRPWILNQYTSATATEGASVRKSLACFDTNTGLLLRTRAMIGTTPQTHDILSRYTPDAAGNIHLEEHYGGDTASLFTDALCSTGITSGSRTFALQHDYSFGSLAKTSYLNAGGTPILNIADNTIDQGTGLPKSSLDATGLKTDFGYDTSGRLTLVAPPGTASSTYAYPLASSASSPATVIAETALGGLKTVYTYDGLGRPVLETIYANDMMRCRSTTYDGAGRKKTVSTLGGCQSTRLSTTYAYDALDRPVSITEPDGSVSSFAYAPDAWTTKRTVSIHTTAGTDNAATTTEKHDRQNRLVEVDEPNGTATVYAYDVADHLTSVNMGVQQRTFTYDGRGFLLTETHPELGTSGGGTTFYGGYDARGHAHGKRTGPVGGIYDLSFTYDDAERLTDINEPGHNLKHFVFGSTDGVDLGRLLTARRSNRMPDVSGDVTVTETYQYGSNGRPHQRDTDIQNGSQLLQSFHQVFTYNDLGAVTAPGYPTCRPPVNCPIPSLPSVTNVYTNGMLTGVPGFAALLYNPNGTLGIVGHSNGVTDAIAPDDTGMPRPKSIDYSGTTTCTPPSISQQPASTTINLGASTQLSVSVNASNPHYQWYQGTPPGGTLLTGQTGSTFTTPALTQTTTYWVRITSDCGSVDSNAATVTVLTIPAPTNLTATTQANASSVVISWNTVPGAARYIVEYATNVAGTFTTVGQPVTLPPVQQSLPPSSTPVAYVYRVWSADANGLRSAVSNLDYAVTASTLFTDEQIQKGVTRIKKAHIKELRDAIDALRAAASTAQNPLPPVWLNAPPPSGRVQASNVTTLFAPFNAARSVFGSANFAYTQGVAFPASGGRILSEHIQQIRDALR